MTLDEKVDKIVKDTFYAPVTGMRGICQKDIRDAIYLGIRAFAEQPPTNEMVLAGADPFGPITLFDRREIYKAMMAEVIKSLSKSNE